MAAGLVLPVAGPYIGTWNALALDTQNDDGYELACALQGQDVNETDVYGMTLVESVYRGQNWRCRMRNLEWPAGGLSILTMFGSSSLGATGLINPLLTNIGTLWTDFCKPLVLTRILTGAGATVPVTLTATYSGFAPNSQSLFNLTSKVRELPLELVLYPYPGTGSGNIPVPFEAV